MSLPNEIFPGTWPAGLKRLLLAVWGLFWLLMILVAVSDNLNNPSTRLWQPVLWEGSSALVLTGLMLVLLHYSKYQEALLARPSRWFWQHVLWLPAMSAAFVALTYGLRHLLYAVAGLSYKHEPWLVVWLYESMKIGLFMGLWLGVLFGIHSFMAWRDQQVRLQAVQRALAESRLQQLKAQLQPHFLFNTLNTISALIRDDPEHADNLLHKLAALLRSYLSLEATDAIPLQEEIRLLRLYADIMTSRFAPRVQLQWQLAPDALERSVPALLLQPLLENAFKHGVEPSLVPVHIDISAVVVDYMLVLRITNTSVQHLARADGVGVGLRNCRERLSAHYGERATLTAEQEEGLFAVTVKIRELQP